MGGGGLYLITVFDGTKEQLTAEEVKQMGVQIICNPFLLRFWLQHPDNMTLLTVNFACNFPHQHSWCRMQTTSPPTTSLSISLWCVREPLCLSASHFRCNPLTHDPRYTKPNGEGSQLLPSTGSVPSGVTLGHFADMLAAQLNKLEYHWMQPHGYSSWLRSADATTVPPKGGDKENPDRYRVVYVNPSNGIAFPGGFGRNWRKP